MSMKQRWISSRGFLERQFNFLIKGERHGEKAVSHWPDLPLPLASVCEPLMSSVMTAILDDGTTNPRTESQPTEDCEKER